MSIHEVIKALDIYKRAGQQAGTLSDFYEVCKGLELTRNFLFPVLREPPQSFLATMEKYIREAPRMVSMPAETLEYPERLMLTYKPEEDETDSREHANSPVREEPILDSTDEPAMSNDDSTPPPPPPPPTFNSHDPDDLLGLNFDATNASSIEESNALALAIIPTGGVSNGVEMKYFDLSRWELALVTTPSTDISSFQERHFAGGLDSLTLNSLYDEGAYRASQQPVYGYPTPNPFESSDPFHSAPITSQSHEPKPFGLYQPPPATYH